MKPKSVLKKSQITSIKEGGIEYSNPQDIANALNWFYASVGRNKSNSFDISNHYTAISSIVNSFYFKLTTVSEIYGIIEALKDKPCHIYPVKVLKKLNPIKAPALVQNHK